jgi:hypothetical protein
MPAPKGNKYAVGNNGGRPMLFSSPDELQKKINNYFKNNKTKKTISGLAYHLGFVSRSSFYDYQENEVFSNIIKKARLKIETIYEEKLHSGNATGIIFALKNMGWSDKQEIKQDVNMNGQSLPLVIIQAK